MTVLIVLVLLLLASITLSRLAKYKKWERVHKTSAWAFYALFWFAVTVGLGYVIPVNYDWIRIFPAILGLACVGAGLLNLTLFEKKG